MPDIVPTTVPWNSHLLEETLGRLRAKYPCIKLNAIGRSVMGRPIWQATIGRGLRRVGYNAAHHANEWITTPVLLRFLEEYAEGVTTGGELGGQDCRALFERVTLDLVPRVNPDGVDLVTGALLPQGEPYRHAKKIAESFPAIPFPGGWKANIRGIDPNLCYPAGWEKARQIKAAQGFDRPAPRDYPGPAPLAAPEAAAMFLRTRCAGYRLILAYHAQGKLIYWKYDTCNPAGSWELAQKMGAVSGYTAETTPSASGHAGYKDWFICQFDRPGYTIEVGQGISPLPLSQFDEIYRDNLGILLLGMTGGE